MADSDKVTIVLEAIDNTQGKIEAADRSLKQLNTTNGQLAQTTKLATVATDTAQKSLVGLSEQIHRTEAAFVRMERNILHAVAIIKVLSDVYEIGKEAIALFNAKMQEAQSFQAAERAAKSLNETLESTIDTMHKSGEVGVLQYLALHKEMDEAGTSAEKLRAVTLKLLALQTPSPIELSIERLRSQYKVETALEDQRFGSLKANQERSEGIVDQHFNKLADIAKREYESELKAAEGKTDAQAILTDAFSIKSIEIEMRRTAAIKQIRDKDAVDLETLGRAQLDTTTKELGVQEQQLSESFRRREISPEQYLDKLTDLTNRQELVEIAALANTVDKDEKATQIKIANAKKLAIARGKAITQELDDEIKAAAKKEAIKRTSEDAIVSILGSSSEAAKLFGREGFVAFKALSLGQAVIAGALATLRALSDVPYPANIFVAAAAAAAAAVHIATIAAAQPGYAEGGLIPGPPSASDNRLAMVATGEYIFDAPTVARAGAANVAALHEALRSGDWLSISGGMIPKPSHRSSFASGGLVGPAIGDVGERIQNVSVGFLNSRQEQIDFMRRSGTKILVDQLNRRSQQIVS